ncbi:AERO1 [Scenedesmus sp. PABB004]|nr:AERO1 [Scenedesmus sp. PABB004]
MGRRGWALAALVALAAAALAGGLLGTPAAGGGGALGPPALLLGAWQRLVTRSRPASAARIKDLAETLDAGVCHIQGKVDDLSDCTYAAVHRLNAQHVHPVVSRLVRTAFFRYFKVNIWCDCPLWPDDSMCALRACSVCECEEGEVPSPWLAADRAAAAACKRAAEPDCSTQDCAVELEGRVDQRVEPAMRAALISHGSGWRGINNPWMAEGEADEDFSYINLLNNPERYTGYKGEHAHRIWSAIYNQSCFSDGVSCSEERVFYRLISGMHASISAHLSAHYLLDEAAGTWGPHLGEFARRLGTPETRVRVENLYFAYLFVLRAAMKAAPLLTGYAYDTGLPDEDAAARTLVTQLVANPAVWEACPMPFDEARLWKGENAPALKAQLQATFQNITRIMDCVGCEKCKLWGKLQTLGVATALKILFTARDCSGEAPAGEGALELERNEVIALINLLARFSTSLETYQRLTAELQRQQGVSPSVAGAAAVV